MMHFVFLVNVLTLRSLLVSSDLNGKYHSYCVLTDRGYHFVEHIHTFNTVLYNRVLLTVGTKSDTLFQLLHVVDMSHPLCIHHFEQADSFYLVKQLRSHLLFTLFVNSICPFGKLFNDIFLVYLVKLLNGIVEIVLGRKQSHKVLTQSGKIPVILDIVVRQISVYRIHNILVYHIYNVIVNILAVKHLLSLRVDDLTLGVHNIVVVEDVLSDVKVPALDLLLRRFDYV